MLLARGRSLREVTVGTFCLFHLCIFVFCFAAAVLLPFWVALYWFIFIVVLLLLLAFFMITIICISYHIAQEPYIIKAGKWRHCNAYE